ncbi:MAG: FtsX-like permease family protein [Bacteroidota bacterium]
MNLPYFISSRISHKAEGSFSTVITRVAVVSIAVGVASLLLAFMILLGFQDRIKDKIYSFSGHLLINKYALSTSYEETTMLLSDELVQGVESVQGVRNWQPFAYRAGLLKTSEEVQGVLLKGVGIEQDTVAFKRHLVEGRMPEVGLERYSLEVVLSRRIANYLKLKVGDDVLIFFVQNPPRYRKLQIVGIYETGLEEFDENIIYGDIDLIRRINGWEENEIGGLEVFVDNSRKVDAVRDLLSEAISYELYVEKVSERYLQIFDWLSLLNRNVAIFLVLVLFVAAFSMVSILLILIMERTQMVGVLKALGGSNRLLQRIFLVNGLGLVVRGLFWGNLVAILFGWAQQQFKLIPLDPASYYMDRVPIEFNWMVFLGVNALVIFLIGVTLFIPLAAISRIDPIKSIRFD